MDSNGRSASTDYESAASCLRTLAHAHRLHIVELLLSGEHTVGELAEACGVYSHVISGHLRILKDRGLLGAERRGREVYYNVAEPGLRGIMACVQGRYANQSPTHGNRAARARGSSVGQSSPASKAKESARKETSNGT